MFLNILKLIKKIYLWLPALVFLYFVYVPFISNLFNSNTILLDNKALAEKPKKFSARFAQEFTDYYNDTFADRKKLVYKYVKLKQKLKIDTGQYFYGKDNWMFYDAAKVSNGNSIIGYLGEFRLGKSQLEHLKTLMERERDFYKKYGADYVLMVIPDKENVYAEYMPDYWQKARVSDEAVSDDGLKFLSENSNVQTLRMKPLLLAAKKETSYPLYYKYDTHWNDIGGFIGFYNLMQSLKKYGVATDFIKPFTEYDITENGLSNSDMSPIEKDQRYALAYYPEISYRVVPTDRKYVIVYENDNPLIKGTIMIVGDSFAGAMLPYLARTFERVVNVGYGSKEKGLYQKIMTEYKPQWVVHELIERYFISLSSSDKYVNNM